MNYPVSHAIKSKIWENRSKVFTIGTTLSKLLYSSTQFYGNFLLSLAILFSTFSSVYLKTIYREHMQLLQSSQSDYERLEEKRFRLQVEHEYLSSTPRLQALSQKLDLITPEIKTIQQLLEK